MNIFCDGDSLNNDNQGKKENFMRGISSHIYDMDEEEKEEENLSHGIDYRIRRYIVSAIDYVSSFAYSYAYKSLSSTITSDFMDKLASVAPFTISHIAGIVIFSSFCKFLI